MNPKQLMHDINAMRSVGCTKIAAVVLYHPYPQRYRIFGVTRPTGDERDTMLLELVKDKDDD